MSTTPLRRPGLTPFAVASGGLFVLVSAAVLAGLDGLDARLMGALNGLAQRVPAFDRTVWHLANTDLLKGGLFATAVCWAWYRADANGWARRGVLTAVSAAYAALVVAQVLAVALPARPRPMHAGGFQLPAGVDESVLRGWSSFPSDHAAMFSALTVGLWLASRRLGVWLLAYAFLMIGLARVYLGLHYPSDILAGALIGSLVALILGQWEWGQSRLLHIERHHAATFYTVAFILVFQIGTMFDGPMRLARVALRVVRP